MFPHRRALRSSNGTGQGGTFHVTVVVLPVVIDRSLIDLIRHRTPPLYLDWYAGLDWLVAFVGHYVLVPCLLTQVRR